MPIDNTWPPGTLHANKTYNDTFAKACENRNQSSHNVKTQRVEKGFEVEQEAVIMSLCPNNNLLILKVSL